MGYKTKSMVYAKSLKTGLHLTGGPGSGPDDMLNQKMEADKADKAKVSDKIDITGGVTADIKNGTESLIKKTPEKKERTKREKGKPATKGVDSGVLSGLAGSKGTQTGTALGIIFNKIRANKVSDEKSESSKKEASNGSSTTSTGFGLNKGFDAKTNVALSDKFNKAPGKPDFSKKNKNISNTATKPINNKSTGSGGKKVTDNPNNVHKENSITNTAGNNFVQPRRLDQENLSDIGAGFLNTTEKIKQAPVNKALRNTKDAKINNQARRDLEIALRDAQHSMFPDKARAALRKKAAERERNYNAIYNANQERVKKEVANKYKK